MRQMISKRVAKQDLVQATPQQPPRSENRGQQCSPPSSPAKVRADAPQLMTL